MNSVGIPSAGSLRPLFALSMGDPAGIGPEIAVKACQNRQFAESVVIIGDAAIVHHEIEAARYVSAMRIIATPGDFRPGEINVIDCKALAPGMYEYGKAQALCGKASYHYIERAIELALAGTVDGVITNPICKESMAMAGISYPGHTEIFAAKTGTTNFSMLFMLQDVAVAHVTTHCSLREAIAAITTERVLTTIRLLHAALVKLGKSTPRIAVAGLNPHAGENGLFGNEELTIIAPAIEIASAEGISAHGAYPPDTVFMRAFKGEFDGVVSMLHDHGFVALKSMDFEQGVNITLGLPIIRTSVGHGTAFAIAGKGSAREASLLAAHLAAHRIWLTGQNGL